MKPSRNAIKAADSNALVAIYFDDAGYAEPNTWDNDLKKYSDKYWDAVVYHHYPSLPTSGVTFADLMALDNWQLASNTTVRMLNYLMHRLCTIIAARVGAMVHREMLPEFFQN